jgi:hypothetical protein
MLPEEMVELESWCEREEEGLLMDKERESSYGGVFVVGKNKGDCRQLQ